MPVVSRRWDRMIPPAQLTQLEVKNHQAGPMYPVLGQMMPPKVLGRSAGPVVQVNERGLEIA